VTTPATVWIIVGVVSTLAIGVVLAGLVRHVFLLGRTLRRFQEEVQPIAEDIAAEGERASSRAARLPR
jgi:FlaG/FlaF family flagellin (archaellin)